MTPEEVLDFWFVGDPATYRKEWLAERAIKHPDGKGQPSGDPAAVIAQRPARSANRRQLRQLARHRATRFEHQMNRHPA